MAKSARTADSLVAFLNSQGVAAQGTLLHLDRHVAVFEVYNPYSIVQLSEVLQDLRVRRGGRDIYRGRAVVTNLVNTGLMLIVSVSLVEPWSDFVRLSPGPLLREEVRNFVGDWREGACRLMPEYQVAVSQFRNFLLELSRWLDHGETLAGINDASDPDQMRQFVHDIDGETQSQFREAFAQFEDAASKVSRKDLPVHRAFAQRELHPVILCAPFMHRTFTKPLGYAGDYQMVNMMLGDPLQGTNTFAKILNAAAIRADAPRAHRHRIYMLKDVLVAEAERAERRGVPLRVLNIGCGPAAELEILFEESCLASRLQAHLMDFNQETLDYARLRLTDCARRHGRSPELKFELRSVNELIQNAMSVEGVPPGNFDVVYCAGLFDYFGDPTCQALIELFYAWTKPGGMTAMTNVAPHHSTVGLMGHLLEWNLKLRNVDHMQSLVSQPGEVRTMTDPTGVNVFMTIRKPCREAPDAR